MKTIEELVDAAVAMDRYISELKGRPYGVAAEARSRLIEAEILASEGNKRYRALQSERTKTHIRLFGRKP